MDLKNYPTSKRVVSIGLILTTIFLVLIFVMNYQNNNNSTGTNKETSERKPFADIGLLTDTSKSLIDLDLVLSGGPPKDGIPAIREPKFTSVTEAEVDDEIRGLLFEHNDTKRFYPYNILVWHEIVNDRIDDLSFAVTFCPLCGSGIVYDRTIDDRAVEFGVSGKLYESNLLMYDSITETLWSQIEGRALVGEYIGKELDVLKSQLLTFAEVKEHHSRAEILSQDTGYSKDYSYYPYGDYDTNDDLYFPVTYKDRRLPLKEIMYAVRFEGTPVAFNLSKLREEGGALFTLENGEVLTATYENGNAVVLAPDGDELPGYFTQWFSWANHNLPAGVNSDAEGEVWGI